ncbi:M20 metallopeptidase family protein [Oscillospiraceae bacterium LTW-04]|nr:amidohydrolase [Oscillospiraceae bacterium MB24-C1]
MTTVNELIDQYSAQAIEIRRKIHAHPELGYEEYATSNLILNELARYGIVGEQLPGLPTSVIAVIRGSKPGKTVGIREDIDALPLTEETGLAFASQNVELSHACGHDIHTAALLLTARVLNELKSELCGNVRLIFQPAEERVTGAKKMIEAGLMTLEPKCDNIIGVHVSPEFPAGSIGVIKGAANAATDAVSITVKGSGGHGAHPYRCVDPIITSAYLLTQLQSIISRENPALQPAVLTFGMIHGGTAMNIIPSEVKLEGTLRTFSEESRHNIWEAIRRVSKSCCEAMRAEADVVIEEGVPALINADEVIDRIAAAAEKTIGTENVIWYEKPSPGSDDFSRFLDFCPGAQFRVGTGNDLPESRIGLHNPKNIFDEKAIGVAAAVMAQYTLDFCKM